MISHLYFFLEDAMKKPDRKSQIHLVMGKPSLDPDCEVCRAHGLDPEVFAEEEGPFGGVWIVEMEPLDELFRCHCPLCSQIRR